jgi:hypothetical protein
MACAGKAQQAADEVLASMACSSGAGDESAADFEDHARLMGQSAAD